MNTTDTDAAITACALMIKGICLAKHSDDWTKLIEARIRFMLASQDQLPDTEAGQCAHCGHNALATPPQTDGATGALTDGQRKLMKMAADCIAEAVTYGQDSFDEPPQPVSQWDYNAEQLVYALRAEIAATHAPAMAEMQVPEGWKLVPHIPTQEMLEAGREQYHRVGTTTDAWQAMYCAAPDHAAAASGGEQG